jgi:hypothetical protein
MEALVALSLAGNVVQFVQFASQVLSEAGERYKSAINATAGHLDLESVIEDLRKLLVPLQTSTLATEGPAAGEFKRLLGSCTDVAKELYDALQELRVKDGPHPKWRSISKALLSVWKKEKLSSFEQRLCLLRDEIQFHIVNSLRYVLNTDTHL